MNHSRFTTILFFLSALTLSILVPSRKAVSGNLSAHIQSQAQIITNIPSPVVDALATPSPTLVVPTKPIRPTQVIPPPANPRQARAIIGLGVITVIIIIIGLWLNIRRIP